jgi:hypothetical protein
MKRETKRILVFGLFAILAISFLISITSAAPTTTPWQDIKSLFSGASTGNIKLYSVQFLFFMLVTLIILAVSNSIPFLEGQHIGIRFGVSLIIGILATFYLAPEEIYTALMGYQALGILLTTIIPFIVLLTITIQWDTKYPEYTWFTQLMWVAYLTAYLIKYGQQLYAWLNGQPTQIGVFGLTFVLVTGIVSVIMIVAGGWISRFILRKRLKGLVQKSVINNAIERTAMIARLEALRTYSPELSKELDAEITKLNRMTFTP